MRNGIKVESLAILLPSFAIGSLISQLPLGILSDKYGRKVILLFATLGGFISFTTASFFEHSLLGLFCSIFVAGMLVGSTFSLGISYMSDLLPKSLLPAGNIMCGISFSLGSIIGPFIGGLFIQWTNKISFFYVISTMLLIIFIAITTFKEQKGEEPKRLDKNWRLSP